MTVNHVVNVEETGGKQQITVSALGNRRKEVEKALQYAFNRKTSKVRSGLISANLAEPNKSHPHYQTYKDNAEKMNIVVHDTTYQGKPAVRVTIEDNS